MQPWAIGQLVDQEHLSCMPSNLYVVSVAQLGLHHSFSKADASSFCSTNHISLFLCKSTLNMNRWRFWRCSNSKPWGLQDRGMMSSVIKNCPGQDNITTGSNSSLHSMASMSSQQCKGHRSPKYRNRKCANFKLLPQLMMPSA